MTQYPYFWVSGKQGAVQGFGRTGQGTGLGDRETEASVGICHCRSDQWRNMAHHNRHRFGSKSEAADQLNLQLRLKEKETAAARIATKQDAAATPELKEKPKRKPLPPDLPRHEQVLTPGEVCKCGGSLRAIGEDVTEELEYVPGRFIVNRIVRPALPADLFHKSPAM